MALDSSNAATRGLEHASHSFAQPSHARRCTRVRCTDPHLGARSERTHENETTDAPRHARRMEGRVGDKQCLPVHERAWRVCGGSPPPVDVRGFRPSTRLRRASCNDLLAIWSSDRQSMMTRIASDTISGSRSSRRSTSALHAYFTDGYRTTSHVATVFG